MLRPEWILACNLDAPDESEAQLTALDLAARPPAKLAMVKCLLACGATPTPRVLQTLIRNSEDGSRVASAGGGGWAAVRECFLGAIADSKWAINPLIPGLNLYVAIIASRRQVNYHAVHAWAVCGCWRLPCVIVLFASSGDKGANPLLNQRFFLPRRSIPILVHVRPKCPQLWVKVANFI